MFWNKLLFIIIVFNFSKPHTFYSSTEFTIQLGDRKYLALLYLKEKIQITIIEIEVISSTYYYIELSLESLCKHNKIFKQYDTLKEAYDCIHKLFEKEKIKLYNIEDSISLRFLMNSASCDNEEVIFKLEEKKMSKDEINEKIRLETNALRKTIKILEQENIALKNIIKDHESRLGYLELKEANIDTKIMTKKSELMLITNELQSKTKKSGIKFTNIFRASRNGNQYNNMNNILIDYIYKNLLILLDTTKGYKFGIFLNKLLNNNDKNNYRYNNIGNNQYFESKSFIFSFDTNKIYYVENYDKIICFNNKCSIDDKTKNCLFIFCNNNLLSTEKKANFLNQVKDFTLDEINGGEKYFNLKEIEIFQITQNKNIHYFYEQNNF